MRRWNLKKPTSWWGQAKRRPSQLGNVEDILYANNGDPASNHCRIIWLYAEDFVHFCTVSDYIFCNSPGAASGVISGIAGRDMAVQ